MNSDLSPTEHLALLVSGKPPEFMTTVSVHPVMIRVPLNDLFEIDAMAKLSGKSRSQMCVLLLNSAIHAVREKMDPESIEKLNSVAAEIIPLICSDSKNEVDIEK